MACKKSGEMFDPELWIGSLRRSNSCACSIRMKTKGVFLNTFQQMIAEFFEK
jgi:hypothetical protein